MDLLLGDLKSTICIQCNRRIINHSNQHCRRQFLPASQRTRGIQKKKRRSVINNLRNVINKLRNKQKDEFINELDDYIKETQLTSRYCDNFIEWIPYSSLENMEFLINGGSSKVYSGTWNLLLSAPLARQLSSSIALKVIKDSDNINEYVLNEFKMHHKCRSQSVIPFYGITKVPEGEYAMVTRYAEYGDLRNYIRKFFSSLNWTDKADILIKLSKALNSIHQMNLLHRDFHCKNILVDEDHKILINDFELCQPIRDSKIVSKSIQGVFPYIAPEILRKMPYTKQSEVYSISMIMWELTSNKPPLSEFDRHDKDLALNVVVYGMRPRIIEETPDFYVKIMQQCWNADPLKRPDASLLPKIFEDMMELCKMFDYHTSSSKMNFWSLPQHNLVTDSEYETEAETLNESLQDLYYYDDIPYHNYDAELDDFDNWNYSTYDLAQTPSIPSMSSTQVVSECNEEIDDPRYNTQTYKFSLGDLNQIYEKYF